MSAVKEKKQDQRLLRRWSWQEKETICRSDLESQENDSRQKSSAQIVAIWSIGMLVTTVLLMELRKGTLYVLHVFHSYFDYVLNDFVVGSTMLIGGPTDFSISPMSAPMTTLKKTTHRKLTPKLGCSV